MDDNDDDACDCIGDIPSIEWSSRWSIRLLFFTSLFLSHYTFKLTKSSLLKGHPRDPNWICSSSSFTPLILHLLPDFVSWFPRNFRLLDSFKHDDTYSYGTNLIDGTELLLPFAYKKKQSTTSNCILDFLIQKKDCNFLQRVSLFFPSTDSSRKYGKRQNYRERNSQQINSGG